MMTIFGRTKLAATIALQYQAIAFWVRMERERSALLAQQSLCLGFDLCVMRSHSFKHCTWKFGICSKSFSYLSVGAARRRHRTL
ncbi:MULTISPECIES: hypothetical protein [Nostocales]|uniref:Uncharacterized protein n=2 Tax=Nostocales TaxID=1161 RepID=A0A8S9T5K1_9CYAN|nr:hypothetical protein [Tolypothrix bouteillei]KAF3886733.1 hypothetical protein DA73_0400015530 [Tolypothrix bouteillei VB521301]